MNVDPEIQAVKSDASEVLETLTLDGDQPNLDVSLDMHFRPVFGDVVGFERWLREPGDHRESRVIRQNQYKSTEIAYFDSVEHKLSALSAYRQPVDGSVYYMLNPVDPALMARANNRFRAAKRGEATKDDEVTRIKNFLIDVDAERLAGISATDAERDEALAAADRIAAHLAKLGWPAPAKVSSGNGCQLIYAVDLPNDGHDGPSQTLLRNCQKALALGFDTDGAKVDAKNHNASRIAAQPGTWKRKGEDMPDRPHRPVVVLSVPKARVPVPRAALEALAAEVAPEAAPASPAANSSDPGAQRGAGASGPVVIPVPLLPFDLDKHDEPVLHDYVAGRAEHADDEGQRSSEFFTCACACWRSFDRREPSGRYGDEERVAGILKGLGWHNNVKFVGRDDEVWRREARNSRKAVDAQRAKERREAAAQAGLSANPDGAGGPVDYAEALAADLDGVVPTVRGRVDKNGVQWFNLVDCVFCHTAYRCGVGVRVADGQRAGHCDDDDTVHYGHFAKELGLPVYTASGGAQGASGASTSSATSPPMGDFFVWVEDLHKEPPRDWLVEGFVGVGELSVLAADYAYGKSLLALSLAHAVASEEVDEWMGHGVLLHGPVAYAAGEGFRGFRDRVPAVEEHTGVSVDPERLAIGRRPLLLLEDPEVDAFIAELALWPEPPLLVVVDTLSRSIPGADENSQQVMSRVVAAASRIQQATGAHVLILHHVNARGLMRGSTVLPGATDTIIGIDRKETNGVRSDLITVRCEKMKDGGDFEPFTARIVKSSDSVALELVEPAVAAMEEGTADWMATRKTLDVLRGLGAGGATHTAWKKATADAGGVKTTQFSYHVRLLKGVGHVVHDGKKKGGRYRVPEEWLLDPSGGS